jgi:DNA replication and repair protein RecF
VVALGGEDASDLAARLAAGRRADRQARRTLAGPHRQDLVVTKADGMPAALASTGEQKAMLVAIMLAHAELVGKARGRTPILLLDEAVAHLDPERRAALFARLALLGGQAWLTGTDAPLFDCLEAARFLVDDGAVRPV